MDILSIVGVQSKHLNICRCCLKADGSMDISSCFPHSGEVETYEEMLTNTFNVQISHLIPNAKSLICEACIRSLREASSFKQMVLKSEDTLLEYLSSLDCEVNILMEQELKASYKTEVAEDFRDSDDSPDDNEILANMKLELGNTKEKTAMKLGKCNNRKPKTKKCKTKENHDIVSHIPPEKEYCKIAETRGNWPLLRSNSLKLIQNSTLCAFQWHKSRYRCFCCNQPFSNINLLKQHTFSEHTLENIEKKIILLQNRLVKVEISDLECKLCREKLEDMSLLIQHLSRTHSMDVNDHLLVPFRIEEELKCQICFEKFSFFRLLNIHVNRHYQKQVCHICGAGFANLIFLNLHKTRSHRLFDCKSCQITFNSRTDKKHHDTTVHDIEFKRKSRYPCTFCPERFWQENFKVLHMVEKHGLPKPEYKCTVCSKNFITRSLCNNHVKLVHNKERNHECQECHSCFYTKSDLARHKVTHTKEKKYSCEMCNNPFASRDSLRRHMKRTHVGVN